MPPTDARACRASPPGPVARTVARMPPTSFFLTSAVFHYLGPALAVLLFAHVAAPGALRLAGIVEDAGPDGVALGFELPMALPPAGEYPCHVDGKPCHLRIDRDIAYLRADVTFGDLVRIELDV